MLSRAKTIRHRWAVLYIENGKHWPTIGYKSFGRHAFANWSTHSCDLQTCMSRVGAKNECRACLVIDMPSLASVHLQSLLGP